MEGGRREQEEDGVGWRASRRGSRVGVKQPRESGGGEEKKKIAIARESERGWRSRRGEAGERGKKNKGKKERWRREVDGTEGGGTGCRPKENVRGGGERVAKYRSSSLVRNKEQKIDRLLSFMFPGAGGEGGALAPLSLSLLPCGCVYA